MRLTFTLTFLVWFIDLKVPKLKAKVAGALTLHEIKMSSFKETCSIALS